MMNNPHRFPRPPTLPQSKIQIKTQRDPKPVDTITPPTFASMLGRNLGGSTGVSSGADDPIPVSPGAFTTSFDLLSIAKVVPAKARRISNPVTALEGQPSDRNAPGEQSADNQNGDFPRYMTSNGAFGTFTFSQSQDIPKSMIFRRQGTASSTKSPLTYHRTPTALRFDRNEETKDDQSKVVGIPTEGNGNSSNESNVNPLPNPFVEKDMAKVSQEPEDSPGTDLLPVLEPLSSDPQGKPRTEEGTELQDSWDHKDLTEDETAEVVGGELGLPQLTELISTAETRVPRSPIFESNQLLSHIATTKNINDGVAILRAAAIPFEPKQVEKNHSSSLLDGVDIDDVSRKRFQPENFTNLSDKFYGKTFNPSGEGPELPPRDQHQLLIENSHHRLQLAIQNPDCGTNMGSLGLGRKRARLSDAAISQLWDVNESEGNSTSLLISNTNANKLDRNSVDQRTSGKPIVPTAGGTPGPALQAMERLDLRALDISQNKGDVTNQIYETLIDDFLQQPQPDNEPTSGLRRRGAVNMIKITKDSFESFNSNGGIFKRPTLEAQRKELIKAKGGERWWKSFLEPTSDIEIRMRIEGNGCKETERGWLYPYPKPEGKETVASELTLALYQQLLSYLIPPVSNGVVSDNNYWSFGARKIGCRHFSTREPWYTKDFTSFFDMGFGANSSNPFAKVTINPPPGLSLISGSNEQQSRITPEESVGIRDLVESSIPDFNNYIPGNYTTREAKTLQEWNSTPINIDADTSSKASKSIEIPRKSLIGAPPWNESRGDGKRGGTNSGPSNSVLDKGMSEFETLARCRGTDSRGSIKSVLNMGYANEDLKGLTAQQNSDVFGGARKMGEIVFGSDEESV